jgi:acyl-coenzyme A synthetase/AMP-(fatty) acid ligase
VKSKHQQATCYPGSSIAVPTTRTTRYYRTSLVTPLGAAADSSQILVDTKAPDNPLSWKQIKTLVCQAAAGFRASGIKKGECVFFISQSNVYYYPLIYACIATGAIYCGGSVRYSPAEAATRARAADAKHFVVEPAFLPQALEAVKSLDLDISRIIVFDTTTNEKVFKSDLGSFATWKALLEHGSEDWERFDDADTAKNTIGMRFFTSGTSGLPKAVQVSHYSLVAHINPWDHLFGETARRVRNTMYSSSESDSNTPFSSRP